MRLQFRPWFLLAGHSMSPKVGAGRRVGGDTRCRRRGGGVFSVGGMMRRCGISFAGRRWSRRVL